MPSDIGTKQNSPDALKLLRGVRRAYGKAKRVGQVQLGLAISAAVASPVAAHLLPAAIPYVAIYGAVVLCLDLLFLEPTAKRNHETGARIQELFDEKVLSLPWKSRHRPELGVHQLLAKEHQEAGEKLAPLKNWYPPEVDVLPIEQARLVCQRSNMDWDASLRERVWHLYLGVLIALVSCAALYATQKNMTMGAVVVQVLVPVVAVSVRLTRKVGEHKAAAGSSSQAKRDIDRLWRRVASGELTARQLDEEARTMQEDLYERRLRSPQVPDLIYRWRWRELEAKMKAAATEMIAEAQRAPPALPAEGEVSSTETGASLAVGGVTSSSTRGGSA